MTRSTMSISALQAAMKGAEKTNQYSNGQYFTITNLPEGTSGSVRFLQDADETNGLFWVEQRHTPLLFPGAINGDQDTDEPVVVRMPCLETWGETDFVSAHFKPYWKGDDESRNYARSYYRQPTFLYSGFVGTWPTIEQAPPDNPIRIFRLGKSLNERVRVGLANAEFEMSPTDPEEGREFKVVKKRKGEWNNYDQSAFSYKSSALTAAQRAAIDQHGLVDLGKLLGEPPTAEVRATMRAMFEDSLAGKPFDQEKYPDFKAWPSHKAPVSRPGSTLVQVKAVGTGDDADVMQQIRAKVQSAQANAAA